MDGVKGLLHRCSCSCSCMLTKLFTIQVRDWSGLALASGPLEGHLQSIHFDLHFPRGINAIGTVVPTHCSKVPTQVGKGKRPIPRRAWCVPAHWFEFARKGMQAASWGTLGLI